MAEGLKIVIGADDKEALAALKNVSREAQKTGAVVDKSFSKAPTALNKGLKDTSTTLKKVTPQVKQLGDSIETLRAKILARKDFLIRETDISKIKIYKNEIRVLEGQMVRLQSVGTSSLGAVGQAGTKAFSFLRTAANVLPGIGIAGLLGAGFSLFTSQVDETAQKLKELIKPIQDIKDAATAGTAEELSKVNALSSAVLDQTLSYKQRNNALTQLKDINKAYFGDLTVETAALGLLKTRVDEYTQAITSQAVIKAFASEIGEIAVELSKQERAFEKLGKAADLAKEKLAKSKGDDYFFQNIKVLDATGDLRDQGKTVDKLKNQMGELTTEIQKAVNTSLKFKPLESSTGPTKAPKDFTNETIAQAKKIADYLRPGFIINFEISPLDTKAETLSKAQKFLDDVAKNNLKVRYDLVPFGFDTPTDFEVPKKIENDTADKISKGILKGVKVLERTDTATMMNLDIAEFFSKEFAKFNATAPTINYELAPSTNQKTQQDALDAIIKQQKQAQALAQTINEVLTPAFDGLVGAIKSGENPMIAFFQGMGQAVLQLIQKLIQAAITAALLAAIFPAGVVAGGPKGFRAIFGSLLGFAAGGLVSGPTMGMIGEGSGTSLSNPEVVAPLDRLKAMLGDMGGGRNLQVQVVGNLRGRDMRLQNARSSRAERRWGA